ncbi:MAG: hypothetical protein K0U93_25360 [Gammaproteobacteria bacterium]|nr:hypothetical protein [Gammaproteobacteria bacterium]
MRLHELGLESLARVFAPYGLNIALVPDGAPIPGSHWGEPEAGLVGHTLHARNDTPVHSVLHEGAHFVCMDDNRRAALHTDAGGDALEECAVCYLSILWAGELTGFGQARMFEDMDRWGYSFRLSSASAWFESDAGDALEWLRRMRVVGDDDTVSRNRARTV